LEAVGGRGLSSKICRINISRKEIKKWRSKRGALNKDFEDRNVNPALQDITPNEIGPYLDNKGILPSEWVAKKRASILKIYSGFSTCVWHGPWLV
jgi:hypothetical protein